MNPVSRVGFFLILVSLVYIFARQPFFDRAITWAFSQPGNVTSQKTLFFTRSSNIILSIDVPRDINSTLIFLRPDEVGAYLQNQPLTAETSRYEGPFTITLQTAQRGIHALVLNFSTTSPYLGFRVSSQGISESEYTDQIIIFIVGVLLLSSSFLKKQIETHPTKSLKKTA